MFYVVMYKKIYGNVDSKNVDQKHLYFYQLEFLNENVTALSKM